MHMHMCTMCDVQLDVHVHVRMCACHMHMDMHMCMGQIPARMVHGPWCVDVSRGARALSFESSAQARSRRHIQTDNTDTS